MEIMTTDHNDDHSEKLPALPERGPPPLPSPAPTMPRLSTPGSSGFLSRWQVDSEKKMLQALYNRQAAATALIEEYGRTAEATRASAEQVALLHDLDAIREEARFKGADERAEAAHQRRLRELRREQEMAEQHHRTNAARYGERVFRETEPELVEIRKKGLREREHDAVKNVIDAEARVLSAEAMKNNAYAEKAQTENDLAEYLKGGAAQPPTSTPPDMSHAFSTLEEHLRQARAQGDQAAVNALNYFSARLQADDAYAPGTTLNLSQVLAILDDAIKKATARQELGAVAALSRLRDELKTTAHR
jgi:hypothetical protein